MLMWLVCRLDFQPKINKYEFNNNKWFVYLIILTVSHLAIIRSFSNFANSRLSLIVVSSFHSNKRAIPINTIAPITPNIIPKIIHDN